MLPAIMLSYNTKINCMPHTHNFIVIDCVLSPIPLLGCCAYTRTTNTIKHLWSIDDRWLCCDTVWCRNWAVPWDTHCACVICVVCVLCCAVRWRQNKCSFEREHFAINRNIVYTMYMRHRWTTRALHRDWRFAAQRQKRAAKQNLVPPIEYYIKNYTL